MWGCGNSAAAKEDTMSRWKTENIDGIWVITEIPIEELSNEELLKDLARLLENDEYCREELAKGFDSPEVNEERMNENADQTERICEELLGRGWSPRRLRDLLFRLAEVARERGYDESRDCDGTCCLHCGWEIAPGSRSMWDRLTEVIAEEVAAEATVNGFWKNWASQL